MIIGIRQRRRGTRVLRSFPRPSRLRFYQKNGWRRTHQMLIDADGEFEALVDQNHFDKKDFAKTLKQMSLGFYRFRIEK